MTEAPLTAFTQVGEEEALSDSDMVTTTLPNKSSCADQQAVESELSLVRATEHFVLR